MYYYYYYYYYYPQDLNRLQDNQVGQVSYNCVAQAASNVAKSCLRPKKILHILKAYSQVWQVVDTMKSIFWQTDCLGLRDSGE